MRVSNSSIFNYKKTGIIIAENQENEEILQNYGEFTLDRQRCYGKIKRIKHMTAEKTCCHSEERRLKDEF